MAMIKNMTLRSAYDDLDISLVAVLPKQEPRAVLQILHGVCGCKERFIPFMEFMADNGIACVAGDHRGHGASVKSQDDLGYFYSGGYKALVSDARMITEWIKNQYPGKRIFLLGHSMGSMAARVYVKEDDSDLSGLILCGSPSRNSMMRLGIMMTSLLCKVGYSRLRVGKLQNMQSKRFNARFASEGFQAWTCSDPEERKKVRETPVCNFELTSNGSHAVLKLMDETYSRRGWKVSQPRLPIVFMSGTDDSTMEGIKNFRKSVQQMSKVGYMDVTSVLYPGMRHEVLNEVGKEDVWKDILDYMKV